MANKRKHDIAEIRMAMREAGGSVSKAAKLLGCQRSTVYGYLRKYPDLASEPVMDKAQYPREAFEAAIRGSHGIKAVVAERVGCSRNTVDNAMERWRDLAEMLDAERSKLVSMAVSGVVSDIESTDSDVRQRAYLFVLKTIGKNDGFTERTEVTGADGQALFNLSPETVQLAKAMGMDMSEVARQFEKMVQMAAVQRGLVSSDKQSS